MNQLGSADLYLGRLYRSIRLGLPDRTAKDGLRFIRRSFHVTNLMHNAPINVKPLGGGGRVKAGDLTVIIVP